MPPECVLPDIQVDVAVRQIHHVELVPERAARKASSELAGALAGIRCARGDKDKRHRVVDQGGRIADNGTCVRVSDEHDRPAD